MRKFLMGLFFTALITSMFCSFPPHSEAQTVRLLWTAPSDNSGLVFEYDVRYSPVEITDATFHTAFTADNIPLPDTAGTPQEMLINGGIFPGRTYWFAIKSSDASGNWSAISNVVSTFIGDDIAPATIIDLRIN